MRGYDYYYDATGKPFIINRSTGEVQEGVVIVAPQGSKCYTPEQQAAYQQRKEQEEKQRLLDAVKAMQLSELGHFYFASTEKEYDLLPATLARLIYLCTFLRFDSETLYITQRKEMQMKDLPGVLGLSRNTVNGFLKDASSYLRVSETGDLCVNTDFFRRGALPKGEHVGFQRIYIKAVRTLYQSSSASKHKHLGYVFLMLPFVNIEHNILCWNPDEKDLDMIQPITVAEFCSAINYDKNQSSRLLREYSKITFPVDGHEEHFCSFVYDGRNMRSAKIFVNPRILYSGSDYEQVKNLGCFCKVKK